MHISKKSVLALLMLSLAVTSTCQKLDLSFSSFENNFLDRFTFTVSNSSNGGSTTYVSKTHGQSKGLVLHNANKGSLQLDSRLVGRKRESIRINSRERFNNGIFVFDIDRMPLACGALVGRNFDEIDILENINERRGYVNFHTSAKGCKRADEQSSQSAEILSQVCSLGESTAGSFKGCISSLGSTDVDLERFEGKLVVGLSEKWVRIYYVKRKSAMDTALSTLMAAGSMDWNVLGTLGRPLVNFNKPSCDKTMFRDMQLVINTNFCGGWAQGDWSNSCAQKTATLSCSTFVTSTDLESAYWRFQSIRFYSESRQSSSVEEEVGIGNGVGTVGMTIFWVFLLLSSFYFCNF